MEDMAEMVQNAHLGMYGSQVQKSKFMDIEHHRMVKDNEALWHKPGDVKSTG